jgi:RNA polymerase sigma factor (sigma-70 family)
MKRADQNEMEARFVRVFDAYGPALRRLCSAYRSDVTEQQDLLQEIALAVWTALPRYRGEASERTWIYRIAHNVALTFSAIQWRRDQREKPFEPLVHDCAANDDSNRRILLDAIQTLKPAERQLIVLYLEGLTQNEIAEITGLTADNVGVRLSRIRRNLASSIGRKEPHDERATASH